MSRIDRLSPLVFLVVDDMFKQLSLIRKMKVPRPENMDESLLLKKNHYERTGKGLQQMKFFNRAIKKCSKADWYLPILSLMTAAILVSSPAQSKSDQISEYFWVYERSDGFGRKEFGTTLYGQNTTIDPVKRLDMSNAAIPHFPNLIGFNCSARSFEVRMFPQGDWISGSGKIKIEYQFSSDDRVISERWNLLNNGGAALPSGYKDFLAGISNVNNKSLIVRVTDDRGVSRTNTFIFNQSEVQAMFAVKNTC